LADLSKMEARVDIGEIDVPLIKMGQKALLEVDSFKEQKFHGLVTEIANSANNNDTSSTATSSTSSEATKFQVRILVTEKERFLPGMSVTANIETRYRSNALSVPIQSVTTRLPDTNALAAADLKGGNEVTKAAAGKKPDEPAKPIEVVFVVEGDHVKQIPVKSGISDDNYVEITGGLKEGQEVVSGGYKAINRDLEDGKKVLVNAAAAGMDKETKAN
jgi:HlyD family secretion protein